MIHIEKENIAQLEQAMCVYDLHKQLITVYHAEFEFGLRFDL